MCLAADVPLVESGTAGYLGQVTVIKRVLYFQLLYQFIVTVHVTPKVLMTKAEMITTTFDEFIYLCLRRHKY